VKRALFCAAFAAIAVALPLMGGTAGAAKPTRVSITLTCDKGTDSTATVTLYATNSGGSQLGDPVTVHCTAADTRDAVTVDLHGTAKFASINPWTYSKGGGLVGQCAGGVALPANVNCGERNYGSKLQIH
jgi:hypothetical protein